MPALRGGKVLLGDVRRAVNGVVAFSIAVVLTACGTAVAPSGGSSQQSSASPAAVAPVSSAASSPQASTGGVPAPGTDADIAQLVAAAKKEGKITISAPASELWRKVLTSFQETYPEIQVEYSGADSRNFWPQLEQERAGGQYLWDMRIGGPDPQVFAARDAGQLEPVRPLLMFPDVLDESKWFGGWNAFYADKEKMYLPGFIASVSKAVYVNGDLVGPNEITSETDLLNPKWKGQIVLQDPRGGAGLGFLTTFLVHTGEPFVRDLLQQDVVVSGDNRQIAEWIVRGRYPIAIGLRSYDLLQFSQQGLGKQVRSIDTIQARPLSIGSGGIQIPTRAPHPNATKLYVNWLLTQKTQIFMAQTVQENSLRLDVPAGDPETHPDPGKMSEYVPHQTEELLPARRKALDLANQYLHS